MTKKKVTKKKAMARRSNSTALTTIKKQIADEAAGIGDSLGSASGNKIKVTQDKQFQLPDGTKMREPLRLVIVDFNSQNHMYEGEYDQDNPTPPVCFALNKPASLNGKIEGMVPSTRSPNKMNEDCDSCPMNKFGTDNRGRGKACKNIRRLAVLEPDASELDPLLFLDASPSALQGFDGFVAKLAVRKVTPITVITEIFFDAGSDFPVLTFKEIEPNTNLTDHWMRRPEAQILLVQEPDLTRSEPTAKKKRRSKKKTARRAA